MPTTRLAITIIPIAALVLNLDQRLGRGEMSGEEITRAMTAGTKQIELRVGSVSFELVRISPGDFEMGSPETEVGHMRNEGPVRRVRISKAFYLGRYEVTQAQYKEITGKNPAKLQGDSLPATQVSYAQAREFCGKLSQLVGVSVTLPTEAQWEYACRAGTKTRFYSGDTQADLDKVAWYAGNSAAGVHPVGQKQPNAWGLYDMLGNVWEFCTDYIETYDSVRPVDPLGSLSDRKGAIRGGGWMHEAKYSRAACRLISDDMFGGTGVRIAINP
jgi:formylglycine-generating enzyme required for sulfatase activity